MALADAVVHDAFRRVDFSELGKDLDEQELLAPEAFATESWPHAVHVLAHLAGSGVAQSLAGARGVLKRIPPSVWSLQDNGLARTDQLVSLIEGRNYGGVWQTLDDPTS